MTMVYFIFALLLYQRVGIVKRTKWWYFSYEHRISSKMMRAENTDPPFKTKKFGIVQLQLQL